MPTAIYQGIQNAPVLYPTGVSIGLTYPTQVGASLDPVFYSSVPGIAPRAGIDTGYNVLTGSRATAQGVLCAPFSVSQFRVTNPGFTTGAGMGDSLVFQNQILAATQPDTHGRIYIAAYNINPQFLDEVVTLPPILFPIRLAYQGVSVAGFRLLTVQVVSAYGAPALAIALQSNVDSTLQVFLWNPALPSMLPINFNSLTGIAYAPINFSVIPDFANDVNYTLCDFSFQHNWAFRWRMTAGAAVLLNTPTPVNFSGPDPGDGFEPYFQPTWHGWNVQQTSGGAIPPSDGSAPGLYLAAPDCSRYQWIQPGLADVPYPGSLYQFCLDRSGGLYSWDVHGNMWNSYPQPGLTLATLPAFLPYQAQAISLPCFDISNPISLDNRRLFV